MNLLTSDVRSNYDSLVMHVMFAGRLRFGRLCFGINLLTYIGYLICLSSFLLIAYPGKVDVQTGCSICLINADPDTHNHTRRVSSSVYVFKDILFSGPALGMFEVFDRTGPPILGGRLFGC